MRHSLIHILSLLLLSLCARASPLPTYFPPRSSFVSNLRRNYALLKRNPASPSSLVHEGEEAVAEVEKKDWKRPVILSITALGLVQTVGWNYIAVKSFMSNRAKYAKEQKRLREERERPPAKVGDTICVVKSYTTEEEVEERKPGVFRSPCYVLGSAPGPQAQQPTTLPQQELQQLPPPRAMSASPGQQPRGPGPGQSEVYASPSPYPATPGGNSVGVGALVKRGLVNEIQVADVLVKDTVPESITELATSSRTGAEWIPLSRLHRPESDEESRLLSPSSLPSMLRERQRHPLPGFPALRATPRFTKAEQRDLEEEWKKARGPKVHEAIDKVARKKKLKTDDIVFGLTILNTIGNIPSLILTTINAYYYRGNPKVD